MPGAFLKTDGHYYVSAAALNTSTICALEKAGDVSSVQDVPLLARSVKMSSMERLRP